MDFIIVPGQILLGGLIGYFFTVVPGVTLCGYILCSYLGPYTIISYFITNTVLGTYRELVTPALSGSPDVTCNYSFSTGGVAVSKIREIAATKFCLVLGGIMVAVFFNNIGFKSFPTLISWGFVLFYLIFTLGTTVKAHNGIIWLFLIAVAAKLFDNMGMSSSLLAILTSFGFALRDLPRRDKTYDLTNSVLIAPRSFLFGIFSGMVPGLTGRNVVNLAFTRNHYLNGILCRSAAEGLNVGILLLQRGTSKSIICTYLSEMLKGVSFNSVSLIITIVIVGSVCSTWVGLWNLMHDQISADSSSPFYMPFVSIGTIMYFCITPENLIGGLIVGGLLYTAGMIFAECIKNGSVPEETRDFILGAPLLFRL